MTSSADFATGDDGRIHGTHLVVSPDGTKMSLRKVDATMLNSIEVRSPVDHDTEKAHSDMRKDASSLSVIETSDKS